MRRTSYAPSLGTARRSFGSNPLFKNNKAERTSRPIQLFLFSRIRTFLGSFLASLRYDPLTDLRLRRPPFHHFWTYLSCMVLNMVAIGMISHIDHMLCDKLM